MKPAPTLRRIMKYRLLAFCSVSAALLLCGCANDGAGYIVAGTIKGLNATGLVLQDNGTDNLIVPIAASSFQFPARVKFGGNYDVTVASQPPGVTCTVTHGSGTNVQGTITAVAVACNADTYTVAGTISGLTAGGLVLEDNGADRLTVGANATTFEFTAAIAAGGGYSVAASMQPAGLTCSVSNGVGSKVHADIDSISVTCSPDALTLGGTISGLTAGGLVLENNGADNLTIPINATTFQFPQPIAYGSAYAVSVSVQPSTQTCTVIRGTSTATADVTAIAVSCANIPTYTITAAGGANGTVSPSTPVTVNRGAGQAFVATPNSGYGVLSVATRWQRGADRRRSLHPGRRYLQSRGAGLVRNDHADAEPLRARTLRRRRGREPRPHGKFPANSHFEHRIDPCDEHVDLVSELAFGHDRFLDLRRNVGARLDVRNHGDPGSQRNVRLHHRNRAGAGCDLCDVR